jgi:hypothetical protein
LDLSTKTLSLLVLLSLGASIVAVVYAVMMNPGARKSGEDGPIELTPELQALLDGQTLHVQRIEAAVRRLAGESKRQAAGLRGAMQHIGMVRYDAFEDVGGRLSFSCALLDGRGDGVVITSINGRQDTRVYAKPVTGGQSSHNLSEEEVAAIQQAIAGPKEAVNAG